MRARPCSRGADHSSQVLASKLLQPRAHERFWLRHKRLHMPCYEIDQSAMLDHDALWGAG